MLCELRDSFGRCCLFKSEQAATEVTLMQVYRSWGTASEEEEEVYIETTKGDL